MKLETLSVYDTVGGSTFEREVLLPASKRLVAIDIAGAAGGVTTGAAFRRAWITVGLVTNATLLSSVADARSFGRLAAAAAVFYDDGVAFLPQSVTMNKFVPIELDLPARTILKVGIEASAGVVCYSLVTFWLK